MTTRAKIQVILPTVHVVLASLLIANSGRPLDFERTEWILCSAINSPAFLLAEIPVIVSDVAFRGGFYLENAIRLFFVWAVWYGVAVETGGGGESLLSSKTRARRVIDAVAVVFGAAVFVGWRQPPQTPYYMIIKLIWSLSIMAFYGRDLWITRRNVPKRA